jgi:RimJ/RimL family protein N-acetyltransferase
VVTEHGMAYLHGKSIRERALELINIAHPKFRSELIQKAKQRGFVYQDQIELSWEQVHYPEDLVRHQTLRDGSEILFRPVKPTDEPALTEMLYSLSSDSVRRRFFTHTTTFPHKDVQQLTNIDYENNLAIVATVPGPQGEHELVGIGQYFLDQQSMAAEVAFIVQDEWQDKGMGSVLMQNLARAAEQRGIRKFTATVLPENKAMLAVFQNSGYPVRTEFDGETYSVAIDLQRERP